MPAPVRSELQACQEPIDLNMAGAARRSGLQQDVINLYRSCFRAARQKPLVCTLIRFDR